MVGTGVGAKNGILIKGGRRSRLGELEETQSYAAAEVDGAALEKMAADGVTSRAAVIALVAVTEARSEHPLAKAVAVWAKSLIDSGKTEAAFEIFESVTGQGVRATVALSSGQKEHTIWIGSAHFITQSDESYLPSGTVQIE
jgi:Cu+-exporting ATPase